MPLPDSTPPAPLPTTPGESSLDLLDRIERTLRTNYWCWVFIEPGALPFSLISLLTERLPHIQPDSWLARAEFGGLFVNGYEALEDCRLPCPCKVEYYEPKFLIADAPTVFPPFLPEYVIFQDEHLAVVYKPAGLSSTPAKEQRHFSLKASVQKLFNCTVHMPSRLDVSVQGLVVVSLSTAMHSLLQRVFENRQVSKHYRLASSSMRENQPWEHTGSIGRDPRHPVLRQVVAEGGQTAQTHFSLVSHAPVSGASASIFEAKPITGRTHQIRVHAAASGVPIIGDNFYGGIDAPYLHLISYRIRFVHPLTSVELDLKLPSHLGPSWVHN